MTTLTQAFLHGPERLPEERHRVAREQALSWRGMIITRAMPAGFTEADYYDILSGGNPQKPYRVSDLGTRYYDLTDQEHREARRVLDRLCLDGTVSHNVACNGGRNLILQFIGNQLTGTNNGVQYFEVGNGASVNPLASDTTLASGFFRKALTSVSYVGSTEVLLSTTFLSGASDTGADATYTECGVFGGTTATTTIGSGTLYAHAIYAYTKTSSIVLVNDYYIALS